MITISARTVIILLEFQHNKRNLIGYVTLFIPDDKYIKYILQLKHKYYIMLCKILICHISFFCET